MSGVCVVYVCDVFVVFMYGMCVVFVYMCVLLDEAFLMTAGLDSNLVTGDSQFRLLFVYLILSILIDIIWNLRLILIFISLMAKAVEYLLKCFLAI